MKRVNDLSAAVAILRDRNVWKYVYMAENFNHFACRGLGFASNGLSHAVCLENKALWYSQVVMFGQPFHVKLEPGQANIRQALDKVQVPYTIINETSEETSFPQVSIRTKAWMLFVLSEQFDAAVGAKKRTKSTAHYLTFFGVPLSMGDSFDFPTPSQ